MSYRCGPSDWIDLAIGRLEDVKRSLRECDRLRQGCDICEELRQARRCLNKALIYAARVWTAFATGLWVMANEPQ